MYFQKKGANQEQNYNQARAHYKIVLQKYPKTEFAKEARNKLKLLRKL